MKIIWFQERLSFYAEPFCSNSFLIVLWSDRKPIVQRKCKEQLRKEIKKSRYCSAAPPFPKVVKNRQWPDEILNTHRPILFSYTTSSLVWKTKPWPDKILNGQYCLLNNAMFSHTTFSQLWQNQTLTTRDILSNFQKTTHGDFQTSFRYLDS